MVIKLKTDLVTKALHVVTSAACGTCPALPGLCRMQHFQAASPAVDNSRALRICKHG
jgi:hypothetical protein